MRLHIAAAFLSGALAQNATVPPELEGVATLFNETDAEAGGMIGGNMLGSNPCTYAPNTTCYPKHPDAPDWVVPGRPLCCSITPDGSLCNPDGQPCTGEAGEGTTAELVGGSLCTYAPDTTCYPGYGWPLCCAVDEELCNPNGEPCYDASILASLPPSLLAAFGEQAGGMIGGGDITMLGSNPCTYAPNTTCYPQHSDAPDWVIPGRPLCCSITPDGSLCNPDGQPCTGTEGENTTEEMMGESVCTYSPDTTCYPIIGHPICCLVDEDLCNSLGEPCFDASILTSVDPALLAAAMGEDAGGIGGLIGGLGPVIPGGDMMGSNFCTYSPNTTCFPSTNGFPPCCVEDPKPEGCGTGEYPECEKTAVGEPITATSSSNALVFSLAALVGAHVVASMSGMW